MAEDFKKIMRTSTPTEVPEAVVQKVQEIKEEFLKIIPELASKYNNEIPFRAIKEASNYDYQIISDVILNLIMEKKITGFINDGGTEALDDDILIIREKRFVDSLEIDYETGTI